MFVPCKILDKCQIDSYLKIFIHDISSLSQKTEGNDLSLQIETELFDQKVFLPPFTYNSLKPNKDIRDISIYGYNLQNLTSKKEFKIFFRLHDTNKKDKNLIAFSSLNLHDSVLINYQAVSPIWIPFIPATKEKGKIFCYILISFKSFELNSIKESPSFLDKFFKEGEESSRVMLNSHFMLKPIYNYVWIKFFDSVYFMNKMLSGYIGLKYLNISIKSKLKDSKHVNNKFLLSCFNPMFKDDILVEISDEKDKLICQGKISIKNCLKNNTIKTITLEDEDKVNVTCLKFEFNFDGTDHEKSKFESFQLQKKELKELKKNQFTRSKFNLVFDIYTLSNVKQFVSEKLTVEIKYLKIK